MEILIFILGLVAILIAIYLCNFYYRKGYSEGQDAGFAEWSKHEQEEKEKQTRVTNGYIVPPKEQALRVRYFQNEWIRNHPEGTLVFNTATGRIETITVISIHSGELYVETDGAYEPVRPGALEKLTEEEIKMIKI